MIYRRLALSIALACAISSTATAQSDDDVVSASVKPKVKLASYGQNYASTCVGCSQGVGGGGYAGGGFGGGGGPQTNAYGRTWGGAASNRDCSRFYHYPYVYYPQNFRSSDYFRSSDSMYYRYPPEMQIPVYNRNWHNYYPSPRRYHSGHQFLTDVF